MSADKGGKPANRIDPVPEGRVRVTLTINGYSCPDFPHKRYDSVADVPGDCAEELIALWADMRKKAKQTDGPKG